AGAPVRDGEGPVGWTLISSVLIESGAVLSSVFEGGPSFSHWVACSGGFVSTGDWGSPFFTALMLDSNDCSSLGSNAWSPGKFFSLEPQLLLTSASPASSPPPPSPPPPPSSAPSYFLFRTPISRGSLSSGLRISFCETTFQSPAMAKLPRNS